MALYDMNGVPAAAEIESAFLGSAAESGGADTSERTIKLKIDAALKNVDGRYIAELAQQGFSEIAVTTGGKVYEY